MDARCGCRLPVVLCMPRDWPTKPEMSPALDRPLTDATSQPLPNLYCSTRLASLVRLSIHSFIFQPLLQGDKGPRWKCTPPCRHHCSMSPPHSNGMSVDSMAWVSAHKLYGVTEKSFGCDGCKTCGLNMSYLLLRTYHLASIATRVSS